MRHLDENYFKNIEQDTDIADEVIQSQEVNLDMYPWELKISFSLRINSKDGFSKMRLGNFNKLFRYTITLLIDNEIFIDNSYLLLSEIEKERDSLKNFTEQYKQGINITDYIQKEFEDWFDGEKITTLHQVIAFQLVVKIDDENNSFNMWKNGIIKILKVLYKTTKAFSSLTYMARNYTLYFLLCNKDDLRQDNSVFYNGTVSSWYPDDVIMKTYSLIFGRPKTFDLSSAVRLKTKRAKMVANKAYRYVYERAQEDDLSNFYVSLYGYEYNPMKLYFDISTKDNEDLDIEEVSNYFIENYIDKFSIHSMMLITNNFSNNDIFIFLRNINDNTVENIDNLSGSRELDEYSCHRVKKRFTEGNNTYTIVIYIYFCNNKWAYKTTNHTIRKQAEYSQTILEQDKKAGIL